MSYNFIVIDDAPFVREIIKNSVDKSVGKCVGDLPSGEAALETIRRTKADLVILDIVMPQQNGVEVAVAIREQFPAMPIIFVSGLEVDFVMKQIQGFNGVSLLQKPFSRKELNEVILSTQEAAKSA